MSGGIFAHWPNRITALRFIGAFVLFVMLSLPSVDVPIPSWPVMNVAFWLFIGVALTDVLDGWMARKYGLVSAFGRIADPFVDKVMVVGTLMFLAVLEWSQPWVPAWVVVIVLAREFLVTGVRGYVESLGREFPADRFGKLKMLVQCFAIGSVLGMHAFPWTEAWLAIWSPMTHGLIWATLVTSVGSGVSYVRKTSHMLSESA